MKTPSSICLIGSALFAISGVIAQSNDISNTITQKTFSAYSTDDHHYHDSPEDKSNGEMRMTSMTQGRVGIGTETPLALLDVNGAALIDGLNVGRGSGSMGSNTVVGYNALTSNTTGTSNTIIGYQASQSSTTGTGNSVFGYQALRNNMGGNNNCAFGYQSMYSHTTGIQNVAYGNWAMRYNTTGSINAAFGYSSLEDNTTGDFNTAIGTWALRKNNANNRSTAIGYSAMLFADNRTSGRETFNTAVGHEALKGSDTPQNNTGRYNTAIGDQAMVANTSGSSNSAHGNQALASNTSGAGNSALGNQALTLNTSGSSNTAIGNGALNDNVSGGMNTGVGNNALNSNTTGSNNTAIGASAYFSTGNLNNTTCVGYFSGGVVNSSNRIEIGNTSVEWIGGEVQWSTYSDARIKTQVQENVPGLDFITRLRPVTYHLDIHMQNALCDRGQQEALDWPEKYDIEHKQTTGFIAQEVEEAARAAGYDFSGVEKGEDEIGLYSIRYSEFVVPLVKAVQELTDQVEMQRTAITQQQSRIVQLEAELGAMQDLKARMDVIEATMLKAGMLIESGN